MDILIITSLIFGKTWQPIVYSSYGILNDFVLWDDIPTINNEHSIVKALDYIAWVNINKLPSVTETITIIGNIHEA